MVVINVQLTEGSRKEQYVMKFQNLIAYQKSIELAMDIFEISKTFPKEEIYSLTNQIRRSSRNVAANMAEAYPKHFISKLTDSDAENSETQPWLEFALKCEYITSKMYQTLLVKSHEVGKLINFMMLNPEKFGAKYEH